MAQSNQRRKYLTIITVIGCLIVVVGFTPAVQERLGLLPAGGTRSAPTGGALAPAPGEPATPAVALSATSGEIALPDANRIEQQVQLIRGELAARERAIAAQEELLRRQVLAEFWKRQAAAAAATLGFTLIIVLVLVRRAADWSGFSQRLREEESRMRNLQLSVIGALEEFESELAAARAWAAAEARARRPVADRSPATERNEPLQEVGTQGLHDTRPAPPPTPAGSTGYSFGEDEHVGAAVPMSSGGSGALRFGGEPAPEPAAREAAYPQPWQPARAAASAGAQVAPAGQAGSEPDSWARRFLGTDAPAPMEPAAGPVGPWSEPIRRSEPMPAPAPTPRFVAAGPSTREQVERLAAEGYGEVEIARRMGLSREEIHLALMLGRTARAEAVAGPYASGLTGGGPEALASASWQTQRERSAHGTLGR